MELTVENYAEGVTGIRLDGRLDTVGTGAIELRFSAVTGAKRAVIVDLSGVEFMTSLGIRLLLQGARTVRSKGGKLVLLQPRELVETVLKTAGIDSMIQIFHERDAAIAAVSA